MLNELYIMFVLHIMHELHALHTSNSSVLLIEMNLINNDSGMESTDKRRLISLTYISLKFLIFIFTFKLLYRVLIKMKIFYKIIFLNYL